MSFKAIIKLTSKLSNGLNFMLKLNIHDAKTHLSHYLNNLEKEGVIVLCKRNTPIAEIRPIQSLVSKPRAIGLAKGLFQTPESFFEPLPEEIIKEFEGHD